MSVSDVLDFSKIEAGKVELELHSVHLHDCVKGAFNVLQSSAAEKGLTLDYNIEPDVPKYMLGDMGRLRQILINLIGNGIKFTQVGGILLRVSIASWAPVPPNPTLSEAGKLSHSTSLNEFPAMALLIDDYSKGDRASQDCEILFEICDSGIGIPADRLNK